MKGYTVEFKVKNAKYKGIVRDKIIMKHSGVSLAITGYMIEVNEYLEACGMWKTCGEPFLEAVLATDIIRIVT